MRKRLYSIFDRTGNISEPYRKDPDWDVVQIDIQNGIDFLTFDYVKDLMDNSPYYIFPQVGIIAATPCDDYAVCGAKHFAAKDADGRTEQSQKLVNRLKEMIFYFKNFGILQFWQVENPRTRIHTLNPWLKPITQKFNPCDYAGYDPNPIDSQYNKETWLFGEFNKMIPKPLPPLTKENPGWKNFGGKSLATKNARSISPKGYCYAFYDQNN